MIDTIDTIEILLVDLEEDLLAALMIDPLLMIEIVVALVLVHGISPDPLRHIHNFLHLKWRHNQFPTDFLLIIPFLLSFFRCCSLSISTGGAGAGTGTGAGGGLELH